jgi:predicted alpha/beta hydrolase family esterase
MADPVTQQFLILHGWQNHRPNDHWQHWLARNLVDLGHVVNYPQLPEPDEALLPDWIATIAANLAYLNANDCTVICHSLACAAWLHLSDKGVHPPVRRLVFVAPASRGFLNDEPILASSRDMPLCPPDQCVDYSPGWAIDLLPGQGHIDAASGYIDGPSLLDWCASTEAAIQARGEILFVNLLPASVTIRVLVGHRPAPLPVGGRRGQHHRRRRWGQRGSTGNGAGIL